MFNHNRDSLKSQETKRRAAGPVVPCPQCGAGIALAPGRSLKVCPFCGSTISAQEQDPVREWLIRPALSRSDCFRLLSAWLWENYRGAANAPEITCQRWVPWRHDRDESRKGIVSYHAGLCEPGDYPELKDMRLPCGEQRPFDIDSASGFDLGQRPDPKDGESRIIYLPVYIASFRIGPAAERAIIEAATGKVRGTLPPQRDASVRRMASFGVAALALVLEAFLIRNLSLRLIALGLTFAVAEVALGLVWEGLLWRR